MVHEEAQHQQGHHDAVDQEGDEDVADAHPHHVPSGGDDEQQESNRMHRQQAVEELIVISTHRIEDVRAEERARNIVRNYDHSHHQDISLTRNDQTSEHIVARLDNALSAAVSRFYKCDRHSEDSDDP